jgi:pimeloyl-ACP methyl ester carboxylesterase
MSRIHVYCMPGLAASSRIFERISLPTNQFEIHLLEWDLPQEGEALSHYAQRMASRVVHENPVLIGVSFGGILVQEMATFLNPMKVIIISSVKCNKELPRRMRFARKTGAHKLIPVGLLANIERFGGYSLGKTINSRIKLYEKFLEMRDRKYLDWAIEQVVMWDRTEASPDVIHIHGDQDMIFPIKYIKDPIVVAGGTHVMILTKYRWLNANLPQLIAE